MPINKVYNGGGLSGDSRALVADTRAGKLKWRAKLGAWVVYIPKTNRNFNTKTLHIPWALFNGSQFRIRIYDSTESFGEKYWTDEMSNVAVTELLEAIVFGGNFRT